jgi:DNA gyrase inhibitor GyrI
MKIALIVAAVGVVLAIVAMLTFVYVIQNVEQPEYSVIEQQDFIELRDYPSLVVAEVRRDGSRQEGLSSGFGPLARYIFAKERSGDRIAMTAPVVQQAAQSDERIAMTAPVTQQALDAQGPDGDREDGWAVRFIMPSAYGLSDLPPPADDDVKLHQIPPRRMAAIRFSGRTTDQLIGEQEQRLRNWMQQRGLTPAAAPVYAYYNDPFTPGFLRRNEVLIEVKAAPGDEPAAKPDKTKLAPK